MQALDPSGSGKVDGEDLKKAIKGYFSDKGQPVDDAKISADIEVASFLHRQVGRRWQTSPPPIAAAFRDELDLTDTYLQCLHRTVGQSFSSF